MRLAITLARRGYGQVSPNPSVGCVLIRNDLNHSIVGRGWTQPGGNPHAEIEAIRQAGELTKGAIAYTTLEPCCHHGTTPPCSQALIKAGIKEIFIATKDPDKRVSGGGIKELRAAGIKVNYGLLEKEATQLNLGFFSKVLRQKPLITWKVASSADGKIATKTGDSKWITKALSRKIGHLLRAEHDAILTGINTVLKDDPHLDCRLPGMKSRSPQPIVLDTRLRIPAKSKLMQKERLPWIYAGSYISSSRRKKLEKLGAKVFLSKVNKQDRLDVQSITTQLSELGITRLLLECGGDLASSFFENQLIDQIFWFRAPKIIGNDGISAIGDLHLKKIRQIDDFQHKNTQILGEDLLSVFEKKS